MRSRLGFAIALTLNADILLVDEVLSDGDIQFRKKAENAILEKFNSNQTTIFVSHSVGQVELLCERVVWLQEGRVCQVGPASRVVSEYLAEES